VATVRPNRTLGSVTPLMTKEHSLELISACRCCRRSGESGVVSILKLSEHSNCSHATAERACRNSLMRHSPTCWPRPRTFVEALKQISRPLPANKKKPKERKKGNPSTSKF
jgi:hypothetical protein